LAPDLFATLEEALGASQLGPSALVLEVAERHLNADSGRLLRRLTRLRDRGFALALDNVDPRRAAMTELRAYPFDIVKLDRSFVVALAGDPATRSLGKEVVDGALAEERLVIAEGIELDQEVH